MGTRAAAFDVAQAVADLSVFLHWTEDAEGFDSGDAVQVMTEAVDRLRRWADRAELHFCIAREHVRRVRWEQCPHGPEHPGGCDCGEALTVCRPLTEQTLDGESIHAALACDVCQESVFLNGKPYDIGTARTFWNIHRKCRGAT